MAYRGFLHWCSGGAGDGRSVDGRERLIIKLSYEKAALILGAIILAILAVLYSLGFFGGYPARTLNSALEYRDTDRKWSEYQLRRLERIAVYDLESGRKVEVK